MRPARVTPHCASRAMNVGLGILLATLSTPGCTRVDMPEFSAGSAIRHSYTLPHTLRIADDAEPGSLNPHLNSGSAQISLLTMAWLLRSGPDDRPRPELATQVPSQRNGGVSQDGKTIVYHLRHDAKWSDGAPFTAEDVLFSTKTVLDPHTNELTRFFFDDIARVFAPDPYTVVLHLKQPYAGVAFDYFYSVGSPCILPAHLLSRLPNINTASYNSLPVGIGPFTYVRWDRGSQIVLAANPLYFRGRPKLDRIIIKSMPNGLPAYAALRSHAVDLIRWFPDESGGLEREGEFSILRQRQFGTFYYAFNLARPPFDDITVRRAVRLAIDRLRMRQIFLGGNGALTGNPYPLTDSPYPPGHPAYTAFPLAPHDPAAANRMLDRAGWRAGPDGVRVKNGHRLEIWIPDVQGRITDQMGELLRTDLHDIGAEAETRYYAAELYGSPNSPITRGNFDLASSNFAMDGYGDLLTLFGCDYRPPKGWNKAHYCNRSVDALLARFNATYDESARRTIAARIARKMFDDAAIVSTVSADAYWLFNTDLRGFKPNRTGSYENFMNVDI
jgi:peptide/nickel transport system substrate-binding protein